MKINLGCGSDIKRGFINVDMVRAPGVDVVCDLNKYHYPFESNSADMILMQHSLEHLFEPYKAIVECHRILKPGGILEIEVPYGFNCSLYHYHFFNEESLVTIYTKYKEVGSLQVNSVKNMFILKDLRILRAIRFKSYLMRQILKFLDIDDNFRYTEGFFEKILYRNANAWNLKRRINEDKTFGVKSQIRWILEKRKYYET